MFVYENLYYICIIYKTIKSSTHSKGNAIRPQKEINIIFYFLISFYFKVKVNIFSNVERKKKLKEIKYLI